MRIGKILLQALLSLITIMALTTIPTTSVVIAGDVGAVVDLVLQPATQTVVVGNVFSITIEAQCNGQDVSGVSAYLDFDPDYLEVQSITPGTALPTVIQNTYDNIAGTIDYSAGKMGAPFSSGTFTVATVSFKKINAVASTSISFYTTLPRKTDADYGGASKLRNLSGATVTISGNTPTNPADVVSGGNDGNIKTVEKDELPPALPNLVTLSLENLIVSPTEVLVGEPVTISIRVTNTSEVGGSYTVKLKINGLVEETKEIALAAGSSQTVSFAVSMEKAGDYNVEIDGQSSEFRVSSAPSKTNWPLIGGIIAAIAVIGFITIFLLKRKGHTSMP
jgi:hypothetical protein